MSLTQLFCVLPKYAVIRRLPFNREAIVEAEGNKIRYYFYSSRREIIVQQLQYKVGKELIQRVQIYK